MKEAVTHHSFNVEIASEYGIEEAIILQNIEFWVTKNKTDGRNKHDEKYWTYNSAKAFQETFSYMSLYKVKRVLQKLEKDGLVEVGNYNRHKYDHTKWYTLTEKAEKLFEPSPKNENGEGKEEMKEKKTKETLEFQESAKSTNGKEQNQSKEDAKSNDGKFENGRTRTVLNTDVKSIVNNNNNDKQKPKDDVVVQKNNLCNQKKKIKVSKETIGKIKEKTKNLLVKENILTIIKATNCTDEQLLKGVEVLINTPNVTSVIGFTIKAIKENYDVPKRKENKDKSKSQNGFHNFVGSKNNYTDDEILEKINAKK